MTIIIGLVITLGCMLGGFMAMGGHVDVIWQPWESVIIGGVGARHVHRRQPDEDGQGTGKGIVEAFEQARRSRRDYLEMLGVLLQR